jgi:protein MpaA
MRNLVIPLVALAIAGGVAGCAERAATQTASAKPKARDPALRRVIHLGNSVQGRPIDAVRIGDFDSRRKLLVVGCVHGDEPAGIAVARQLAQDGAARESQLWVVPTVNPDGVAADTRQNADAVDLNRNFPYRWRRLGRPGYQQYSGPRPLSEPESRIAQSLILRARPRISIWFHQPLAVVDRSGGSVAVERRFSRLTHLPLRRLTRYPGSAVGWQDHRLPGTTAFVTELPGGRLTAGGSRRIARAVRTLAAGAGPEND